MTRILLVIAAGVLVLSLTFESATAQTNAKPVDAKANATASPEIKVDARTLVQAEMDFQGGRYVPAEKLFHAVLDAIDAKRIPPQNNLPRAWSR